ncbi:MAG: hypothetical protein KHY44_10845 [Clostridiales bacterium]|jgi:multiple inositol-polyphosphate phosphatase/2,3-bisphosphoglycerate 3-phosphatase|nr:hypothetical protein [Clostridiales bacterium]
MKEFHTSTWYLGTEMPYYEKGIQEESPPRGYSPIYVNYLGRHGSRYVTSPNQAEVLYSTLDEADSRNQLTQSGCILKKQIGDFLALSEGKYGLLTPLGVKEEQGIARRMYERFPQIFGREVRAVSTYVTRAKQSMEAFLEELAKYTPSNNFVALSNGEIDPILRFFDLNLAYLNYKEKGKWKDSLRKFEERKNLSMPFMAQFFKSSYKLRQEEALELGTSLYTIYANTFNLTVDLGLNRYFDDKILYYYWENANLRNFLEKGPSYRGEDLPTNIAFALLEDFLKTSEQALQTGNVSADLRFAHAETLIPFASLLKLCCCSKQTDHISKVAKIWCDSQVAPMAGNIQWIFYKSSHQGTILVKMLYNEEVMTLPIRPYCKPYYLWEDVKAFYWYVISKLHIPQVGSITEQVKYYTVR